MRRPSKRCLALVFGILCGSCTTGTPSLEVGLSPRTPRVDAEANVVISATNADLTAGLGTVTLSTSLGDLGTTSLTLADGSARTTFSCRRASPGCVAGATWEVVARWSPVSGPAITQTVTGRLAVAATVTDGGSIDGGIDGGIDDAGQPLVDAGTQVIDAGLFDAGLPPDATLVSATLGDGFVIGRLGAPRTIGLSPLTSNTTVLLGFDRLPQQLVIYGDRLLYLKNGFAFAWAQDFLDGGEFLPIQTDAGVLPDGGRVDAGLTALVAPENNDPLYATCLGSFGSPDGGFVRALLPTPSGALWVGCSAALSGDITLYINGSTYLAVTPTIALEPIAGNDRYVFGLTADAGLPFLISLTETRAISPLNRRYSKHAVRPTLAGFEVLVFDPVFGGCRLVQIGNDGGLTETPQPQLDRTDRCLEGQFLGQQFVYSVTDPQIGVRSFPIERGGLDAGRVDAGPDAGVSDSGVSDSGVTDFFFFPGPPSDFTTTPPTLSVDFTGPVKVVTKP